MNQEESGDTASKIFRDGSMYFATELNMEQKESKSKKHFFFSLIKSAFRIIACFALGCGLFIETAILLGTAEIIGILEEF